MKRSAMTKEERETYWDEDNPDILRLDQPTFDALASDVEYFTHILNYIKYSKEQPKIDDEKVYIPAVFKVGKKKHTSSLKTFREAFMAEKKCAATCMGEYEISTTVQSWAKELQNYRTILSRAKTLDKFRKGAELEKYEGLRVFII
ncbi:hypothetical protein BC833DRAFT_623540 [Globomyces pollinis-pini]|nr:hypothetical protein BC833DRAFT_625884 [Globomyces pollinis-pini]KAI8894901.1 hypothetical protein BC833DRAFT_623540 [Globomyces pollinis-pini]